MKLTDILIVLSFLICPIEPSSAHQQKEKIALKTMDGLEIHAYRISTGSDTILIYCHPLLNSKDSFDLAGFGDAFLREFDILAFDFRGHGESEGFCTCGSDEVLDLRAAVQYARQAGYGNTVVLGIGMGGAVAIRHAALFGNVDAVVAVSPLGRPEKLKPWRWELVSRVSESTDYTRIPIRMFNGTRISGRYLTGSPVHLVDRVSPTPLLVVHGEAHWYMNLDKVKKLYDNAREPKELLILSRREHSDGLLDSSAAGKIVAWIKRALPDQSTLDCVGSTVDALSTLSVGEIELRGDIVLPEGVIEETIREAANGPSSDKRVAQIKKEVEALLRVKHDVRFGKWLGTTSRWEPLVLSLLFDAGDAREKSELLKFSSPQTEIGIELSYATVIKVGLVKSIGKGRTDPYVYFGWYPNLILSEL